ncbi:LysR family transcriptional regulator [Methyloversatilis sp.]|uniref:LysR family transcriptional regulator n=1 Tax=Methyloversatilis sp. TaxID=2569862 RepID=UPI00273670E0|nr:LysR family transcriptional regulator [Methyloversatilis sp.]MDP2868547.1 LysR family transcriptional regulator [Methyloversatilis sp.]MDP3289479.1 LysR family transcriptional regulator [Methyloversatilis sp.]MDP3454075.1 LysR family transcriptional regulator [Methyloversatilis sp.]MDP3578241.1 LysR family transcriptional regulator [Methyloversatilis sp.]
MNITLRQLQVFAKVAETGSFTRASEQLFLTQPAVSQQVRQLTETVGEPLFDTIGRRTFLTPAGEELLSAWKGIQLQWQQFEENLQATRSLHRGTLRLAAVSTAKYFVPRVLGPYCAQHPGIDVKLEVANRDRLIERMQANLDDMYVMTKPPEDMDLTCDSFLDNPLVAIAPAAHPLANAGLLKLQDLAEERFIMREQGSGTRIAIENYLSQQGATLNVRMELGSNEAIKQAVAGGMGLSILSRHTLHRDPLLENEVVILQVEGFPLMSRWHVVRLQQRRLSRAAEAFLELLQAWIPAYLGTKGMGI